MAGKVFPGKFLQLRGEVFPSLDGAAHLEVFSKEWTQIHNRSPRGLPARTQPAPPYILLQENGVVNGTLSVCIAGKRNMHARA